jgi:LacI family transcriptional regulator
MANINDVAKLAGVSRTLVSRALNGTSGVGADSRLRIQNAMKALNYKPNAIARSLVKQKTYIVGVVMDNLCDVFFFDLIWGIEEVVVKSEYNVIFCSAHDDKAAKLRYISFFTQGRADGFIVYGSNLSDEEMISSTENSNFPVVVVEHNLEGRNINNVVVNNAYGSRLALNHLFECGCKKICHITGNLEIKAARDRRDGFIDTMREKGYPVGDSGIIESDFTVEGGYQAVSSYITKYGKNALPDAFYFGGDRPAYGGMMALEDNNIRIPEDIMVASFDNAKVPVPNRRFKGLTTIAQPMFELGRTAMKVLLEDIEQCKEEKKRVVLNPSLVIRETTRLNN